MATISKFEEIIAWQKARELNKIIYYESNLHNFNKDFALRDQIRKSSISIMSNIAEGFERKSNKEFNYFLNVAKGSSGELRSQLYICLDLKYITQETFEQCQTLVSEISSLLSGFIVYLDKKNKTTA